MTSAVRDSRPPPLARVDIALWDAVAKDAGKPLVDVLGRVRDRIPVYASGINLG